MAPVVVAAAVVVVELRAVLHLGVVAALRVLLLLEVVALRQPRLAHKLLLPVLLQVAVVLREALPVVVAAARLLVQGLAALESLRRQ